MAFSKKYVIEGEVRPGFESVKELLADKYDEGLEECSQLCVFVDGEKVRNIIV